MLPILRQILRRKALFSSYLFVFSVELATNGSVFFVFFVELGMNGLKIHCIDTIEQYTSSSPRLALIISTRIVCCYYSSWNSLPAGTFVLVKEQTE